MNLNRSLSRLVSSQTLALNQKAKALAASGRKIYNFTAGEPDGNTPDHVQSAAIHAIQSGKNRYTDTAGIIELREAICRKAKNIYHRTYSTDEVIVSSGGKQAIFNALYTLLNPEDEVVILTPAWVSYPSLVQMLGANVVEVSSTIEQGFVPDVSAIASAITDKTKLLILNSPCNPSGAVYTQAFVNELVDLLEKHPNVFVISDDIYEYYVFEGEFVTLSKHPKFPKERLIIINGVSKSHAMTGWRIGYALADQRIVSPMKKIQSQVTSNPCSISQYAALEAIKTEDEKPNPFKESFKQRRDIAFTELSECADLRVILPQGAFYIFPNVEKVISKSNLQTDVELCDFLLDTCGVATVPGSAFGLPGHLRLSYGLPIEELRKGISLMKEGLSKLEKKA
ncbi:MAG: pyridoxal phosphate-dependent aminotransferase [Bdellovibrionales bacterium]|nr:pyridoxal phosphate-dependent aminotransferase [Bdellovibrionales bacterium]